MKLVKNTTATINRYDLIRPREKILIGVSGGPDSVALLHVLISLRHKLGIKLFVCHVNHQLRKRAQSEQNFVKNLSEQLLVPFYYTKVTIKKQKGKSSVEEIAREKRFQALIQTAKKLKIKKIALAHHCDDLAETVLMRIIRGTGLMGLQSILPIKMFGNIAFIRPLIEVRRNDIMKFLKQNHFSFCEDETNAQATYFRNKIRLVAIPYLKQFNDKITENLSHLAQCAAVDYDYLLKEAEKKMLQLVHLKKNSASFPITPFVKLHQSLQSMIIRLIIEKIAGNTRRLTHRHYSHILDCIHHQPSGSELHLPKHLKISKGKKQINIQSIFPC